MKNNDKPNVNHQTHGHQEGQQNNTGTTSPGNEGGVRNNNQQLSNIDNKQEDPRSDDAQDQQGGDGRQRS